MRLTLFLTCYFATVFLFCFCSAVLFSISLCQVRNTNHRMLAEKHMMQFLCSQQTTINTSQINKQPTNFSKMRVNLHLYHNDFRTNVPFEIVPIVSLSSLSLVFCWNVFHSSGVEDIAAVRMAAAAGKRAFAGGGPRTPRGMEIWFRQQLPEKSERRVTFKDPQRKSTYKVLKRIDN